MPIVNKPPLRPSITAGTGNGFTNCGCEWGFNKVCSNAGCANEENSARNNIRLFIEMVNFFFHKSSFISNEEKVTCKLNKHDREPYDISQKQ